MANGRPDVGAFKPDWLIVSSLMVEVEQVRPCDIVCGTGGAQSTANRCIQGSSEVSPGFYLGLWLRPPELNSQSQKARL